MSYNINNLINRTAPPPDPYANTSLEEPFFPPTLSHSQTARHCHPRRYHTAEMNEAHLQQLITAQAGPATSDTSTRPLERWEIKANDYSDRLTAHYATKSSLEQAFSNGMQQYATSDPEGHKKFTVHFANAHGAAVSDVRAYDVARWYTAIPHTVKLPLHDLSRYYHKEARLRSKLLHVEGRCPGDHAGDEAEYAVDAEMEKVGAFGYENDFGRPDGSGSYSSRFEGRLEMRVIAMGFQVPKVRAEQAGMEEQFPWKIHQQGVDSMVAMWLHIVVLRIKQGFPGLSTMTAKEQKQLKTLGRELKAYSWHLRDRWMEALRVQVAESRSCLERVRTVAAAASREEVDDGGAGLDVQRLEDEIAGWEETLEELRQSKGMADVEEK